MNKPKESQEITETRILDQRRSDLNKILKLSKEELKERLKKRDIVVDILNTLHNTKKIYGDHSFNELSLKIYGFISSKHKIGNFSIEELNDIKEKTFKYVIMLQKIAKNNKHKNLLNKYINTYSRMIKEYNKNILKLYKDLNWEENSLQRISFNKKHLGSKDIKYTTGQKTSQTNPIVFKILPNSYLDQIAKYGTSNNKIRIASSIHKIKKIIKEIPLIDSQIRSCYTENFQTPISQNIQTEMKLGFSTSNVFISEKIPIPIDKQAMKGIAQ